MYGFGGAGFVGESSESPSFVLVFLVALDLCFGGQNSEEDAGFSGNPDF